LAWNFDKLFEHSTYLESIFDGLADLVA